MLYVSVSEDWCITLCGQSIWKALLVGTSVVTFKINYFCTVVSYLSILWASLHMPMLLIPEPVWKRTTRKNATTYSSII